MLEVGLCKSCGDAYDAAEIDDGYCLGCSPEESRQLPSDVREFIAMRMDVLDAE